MWPPLTGFFLCHHNSTDHPAPARPTDPSSPCPGHCGPEEAPPVRILKDVGQHTSEKSAAVQNNLLLFLQMAAAFSSLHQLLHSLQGHNCWAEGTPEGWGGGPWHFGSVWACQASERPRHLGYLSIQGWPTQGDRSSPEHHGSESPAQHSPAETLLSNLPSEPVSSPVQWQH